MISIITANRLKKEQEKKNKLEQQKQKTKYYKNFCKLYKESCNNCAICYESHNSQEICTITTCKHSFGFNCLLQWIKYNITCPMCTKPFICVVLNINNNLLTLPISMMLDMEPMQKQDLYIEEETIQNINIEGQQIQNIEGQQIQEHQIIYPVPSIKSIVKEFNLYSGPNISQKRMLNEILLIDYTLDFLIIDKIIPSIYVIPIKASYCKFHNNKLIKKVNRNN